MKVEGEAVEEVEEILTPDEMKKVEAVKRSITRCVVGGGEKDMCDFMSSLATLF